MTRTLATLLLLVLPLTAKAAAPDPKAVAARVDGEVITLGELLTSVGSLAVVGQEDLPDRPSARTQMLERLITARLLYLDGRDRKLDRTPLYAQDLHAFLDPMLAATYVQRLLASHPFDEEAFRAAAKAKGLTDPRAMIRLRAKMAADHEKKVKADELARLWQAAKVKIHRENLEPAGDERRDPLAPVATVDGEVIAWRRLLPKLPATPRTVEDRARAVERLVDEHLLARAARAAGLDQSDSVRKAVDEFRRQELVKLVREEIVRREGLTDAQVEQQYRDHMDQWTLPEQRKVQQIVVKTREEAEEIYRTLQHPPKGVTFFTLARDRSIVPNHEKTLGMIGWVTREQGHPLLTKTAFSLKIGEVSRPVHTNAGYHIIRVVDIRPKEVIPLDDDTRYKIRARWNADRVQAYAERLAQRYKVERYPEVYELHPKAPAAAAEQAEVR